MSIVKINNLNKTYPAFKLSNVSFDIEEGRITGFIGRNGAGKTTTIKSMLNLNRYFIFSSADISKKQRRRFNNCSYSFS